MFFSVLLTKMTSTHFFEKLDILAPKLGGSFLLNVVEEGKSRSEKLSPHLTAKISIFSKNVYRSFLLKVPERTFFNEKILL